MNKVGIQNSGYSSAQIYNKANELFQKYLLERNSRVMDIGGGAGQFSKILLENFDRVTLIDYEPNVMAAGIDSIHADLNATWPACDEKMDLVIALEVIEHLENPRHFIRQLIQTLRPGGYAIVSTPNQLSLASRICFMIRGQHQHFQESCYPAHITPLLPVDFLRICSELGVEAVQISYSGHGRIPGTGVIWQRAFPFLTGQFFSDNFFVEFRCPTLQTKS